MISLIFVGSKDQLIPVAKCSLMSEPWQKSHPPDLGGARRILQKHVEGGVCRPERNLHRIMGCFFEGLLQLA